MEDSGRDVERRWTIVYTSSSGKKLLVFRCLSISVAAASTDSVTPRYALLVPLKETENLNQTMKRISIFFRSLRCVRNTIHTNLFVALMCNSVAWIVWYHGVVYRMSDWEVGQKSHIPFRSQPN